MKTQKIKNFCSTKLPSNKNRILKIKIEGPPSKNQAKQHKHEKEMLPKLDMIKGKNRKVIFAETQWIKLEFREKAKEKN